MSVDGGLRRIFRAHLTKFDMSAVETGGIVGRGIPDVNFCCDGIEGWLEYKWTKHWKVTIRPEQIGWAERRIGHGGRVYCAGRQNHVHDALYLYPGTALRRLKDERISVVPNIGFWTGGPAKWNWIEIAQILTGPWVSDISEPWPHGHSLSSHSST